MNTDFVWLLLFSGLTLVMFLLLPFKKIQKLIPFGLVAGFLVSMVVQYLAVSLTLYKFNVGLLYLFDSPVGISLSWIPPVMIFKYYFEKKVNKIPEIILIILLFSTLTTAVTYGSVVLDFREYLNWNIYLDFALALIIHLGLSIYLIYSNNIYIGK